MDRMGAKVEVLVVVQVEAQLEVSVVVLAAGQQVAFLAEAQLAIKALVVFLTPEALVESLEEFQLVGKEEASAMVP